MCVCQTAKRRRRQMVLDKRYRKKDPYASQQKDQAKLSAQKAREQRSKSK